MKPYKCGGCGKDPTTTATACQYCGAKRPSVPDWVILMCILTAALGACTYVATNVDMQKEPVAAAAPPKKVEATPEQVREAMHYAKTRMVLRAIKKSMRDPDSLQWIYVSRNQESTVVCTELRARNGFGGMNVEHYVFAKQKIASGSKTWNRHCAGKELVDMLASSEGI